MRRGNACTALERLSRRERQIKKKHPTMKYVVLAPQLLKENRAYMNLGITFDWRKAKDDSEKFHKKARYTR